MLTVQWHMSLCYMLYSNIWYIKVSADWLIWRFYNDIKHLTIWHLTILFVLHTNWHFEICHLLFIHWHLPHWHLTHWHFLKFICIVLRIDLNGFFSSIVCLINCRYFFCNYLQHILSINCIWMMILHRLAKFNKKSINYIPSLLIYLTIPHYCSIKSGIRK